MRWNHAGRLETRAKDGGRRVEFVEGEPALLLPRGERAWRSLVADSGITGLSEIRLRFIVASWRRRGNTFDLDNLVDPVLAVVACAAAQRRSLWATVELGDRPGVGIFNEAAPGPPDGATSVHLQEPPTRSVRSRECLEELVDAVVLGTDEPCGCALVLGRDTAGVEFGFEGPIKPTIDALWPLIGGAAHRPADHRIRDLRVTFDSDALGISVALWLLADALDQRDAR